MKGSHGNEKDFMCQLKVVFSNPPTVTRAVHALLKPYGTLDMSKAVAGKSGSAKLTFKVEPSKTSENLSVKALHSSLAALLEHAGRVPYFTVEDSEQMWVRAIVHDTRALSEGRPGRRETVSDLVNSPVPTIAELYLRVLRSLNDGNNVQAVEILN